MSFSSSVPPTVAEQVLVPEIDGDHWQITGNPDLGELGSPQQQPVDFAIWQAADGTWQCWSCIRHTKCGGNTRLFYGWEADRLTEPEWRPKGIMMQADADLGETPGGLQAPHVFRHDGKYWMVYGDWVNICMAQSEDGKRFERIVRGSGKTGMFAESQATWDPMILNVGDLFHCYYTARPATKGLPLPKGAVYCRTSKNLADWSDSVVVNAGGCGGWSAYSAQCPFVLRHPNNGKYYLFRTSSTGSNHLTNVYRSNDPLDFGVDDNRCWATSLPVAAPEILVDEGRYYVASMRPEYDGLRIARLKWNLKERPVQLMPGGRGVFNLDDPKTRSRWRLVEGNLEPLFTTSPRKYFDSPYSHFIGTAETAEHTLDDARTGVIEGPVFTLDSPRCCLVVSGGSDASKTYVALVDDKTDKEIVRLAGEDSNTFREVTLNDPRLEDRRLRVRVVDRATGKWGHVNFGGIFVEVP